MIYRSSSLKNAFSLLEIIISVSLIVLFTVSFIAKINPKSQIDKSYDSKRKFDLSQLRGRFEEVYTDRQCYPKPDEVCYDTPTLLPNGTFSCTICGTASPIRSLSPYIEQLPCDPQFPTRKYLYQVNSTDCATWFRIYSNLSLASDPIISEVDCALGCGPSPSHSYNYEVSSPNIGLEPRIIESCSSYLNLYIKPGCDICGSYEKCKNIHPSKTYYIDSVTCSIACIQD